MARWRISPPTSSVTSRAGRSRRASRRCRIAALDSLAATKSRWRRLWLYCALRRSSRMVVRQVARPDARRTRLPRRPRTCGVPLRCGVSRIFPEARTLRGSPRRCRKPWPLNSPPAKRSASSRRKPSRAREPISHCRTWKPFRDPTLDRVRKNLGSDWIVLGSYRDGARASRGKRAWTSISRMPPPAKPRRPYRRWEAIATFWTWSCAPARACASVSGCRPFPMLKRNRFAPRFLPNPRRCACIRKRARASTHSTHSALATFWFVRPRSTLLIR